MEYRTGRIGRSFVVRFEHGEAVLEGLCALARKEQVRSAVFFVVGGMRSGRIVVGPAREELPPEPVWRSLDESHETVGTGTIFRQGDEPRIHFHGVYGKGDKVLAGCLREGAEAFIVLEAVVLEIEGVEACRELDPASGMVLLKL